MIKYYGDHHQLMQRVARIGIHGTWAEPTRGHYQYRADTGAILNWWPSTRTLSFQGPKKYAQDLTTSFLVLSSDGDDTNQFMTLRATEWRRSY